MKNDLNIVIATGLFPSDIGGPATYADLLSKELPRKGAQVTVVSYGTREQLEQAARKRDCDFMVVDKEKHILRRYFGFFKAIWKLGDQRRIVYAFDLISVGVPCALAKLFRPKLRLVIRLGGDYQWEKAVQYRDYDNTLEKYYEDKKFSLKERLDYFLTNSVLAISDKVIFNSELLRDSYIRLRNLDPAKTAVIKNIIPDIKNIDSGEHRNEKIKILFAGRLIKARNLKRFIDALSDIRKTPDNGNIEFEILGSGPEKEELVRYVLASAMTDMVKVKDGLPRLELLKKINKTDIVVLPSLTDINPNFIIEALMMKKHVILTKHTEGHFAGARSIFLNYIDPMNPNDMSQVLQSVIERIREGKTYDIEMANFPDITKIAWPLERVVIAHEEVFNELLK